MKARVGALREGDVILTARGREVVRAVIQPRLLTPKVAKAHPGKWALVTIQQETRTVFARTVGPEEEFEKED